MHNKNKAAKGFLSTAQAFIFGRTKLPPSVRKILKTFQTKFANKFNLQKLTYLKARYPDIWKIIEKYRFDRKNIYKQIFTLAESHGYLRENLDPEVCTALYINIFNSIFQPEFMNNNNLSIDQTIDHLQKILSNGFFNKSGIKKMKVLVRQQSKKKLVRRLWRSRKMMMPINTRTSNDAFF